MAPPSNGLDVYPWLTSLRFMNSGTGFHFCGVSHWYQMCTVLICFPDVTSLHLRALHVLALTFYPNLLAHTLNHVQGSLIAPNVVLTAAHCTEGVQTFNGYTPDKFDVDVSVGS